MEPRRLTAELFVRDECVLGEGPFWFEERIWWVDIDQGVLLASDGAGRAIERWSFGQRIGAVVPVDQDNFVLALEKGIVLWNIRTGSRTLLSQDQPLPAGHRFNDGKCDPAGRFIVGSLDMEGNREQAALFAHERGKPLRILREGVSISNGLAWTEDGGTLYYIDTPLRSVLAFDYDVQEGTLSRERTVLTFEDNAGFPDGMAIDREGRLWIAFWDGWAVRCYRPSDGACVAEIRLPCARPTSCCFGGTNREQLFITTARQGLDSEDLARQPLAGSLFVCDSGTAGFATKVFS